MRYVTLGKNVQTNNYAVKHSFKLLKNLEQLNLLWQRAKAWNLIFIISAVEFFTSLPM